ITVGTLGGYSDTFVIQSNVPWTISGTLSANTWLQLDKQQGSAGMVTVKLTLSSYTATELSDTLKIVPKNGTTPLATVIITQKALSVNKLYGGLGDEGINAMVRNP